MTTALVVADPELAALVFVNDCRAELGLPPLDRLPCGIRQSAGDCPIAHALVQGSEKRYWPVLHPIVSAAGAVVSSRDTHRWPLPLAVRQFIEDFDNGRYPHLLEFQR